jgi:hypothetical protein
MLLLLLFEESIVKSIPSAMIMKRKSISRNKGKKITDTR